MATSYANAGGTGDRTATITVTTDFTIDGGTINNLVDGGFGANSTDSTFWHGAQSGKKVVFDFGVGASKIIDEFKWYQDTTAGHGEWDWAGSNDNSSYTTLKHVTNLGATNTSTNAYTNTTGYRYYRMIQTTGVSSSAPWLEEIEFKIDNATPSEIDIGASPALGVSESATLTRERLLSASPALGLSMVASIQNQRLLSPGACGLGVTQVVSLTLTSGGYVTIIICQ